MVRECGCVLLCSALVGCAAVEQALVPYRVAGDEIPKPLVSQPGDANRGREVVAGRDGNCLLCHALPDAGKRMMGDLAPPLTGVAVRLSAGQMRLRIVDSTLLNPATIMPSYYRVEGLNQVAEQWPGKPVLSAQQVEDVIAYLRTLR
jgi:sulfur-oxidizing protein SoxX